MARKKIKKVSVAPLDPITGSIVDSTNIADKTKNAYSANVIDKFNSYSTEETVVGYFIRPDGTKVPRYRKVGIYNCNTTALTAVEAINDLEYVINLYGVLDGTNGWKYPANSSNGTSSDFSFLLMNANIIHFQSTHTGTLIYTIEYTKTTD